MKLNDIWGYGQLFGFSAIDGKNRYYKDFVATLTAKKVGFRFETENWIKIFFDLGKKIKFKAVMSDFVEAVSEKGDFFVTFADADTLVGYSPVLPVITTQTKCEKSTSWGVEIYSTKTDHIGLKYEKQGETYKFALHHSFAKTEARSGANYFINADVENLKIQRYAYYENLPKCKNKKYEKLYYKALAVNKVNVRSAEGKIPCTWTTPDRVPHRHMWLWDSVFHSLAIATYNGELAKDVIFAVLSQMRDDGFISHMMNPTDSSDVTQPQVLAWGVWEVYKKTQDKAFLSKCVEYLDKYLVWDIKNRDKNGNGLLEWFTEPEYSNCRCGESGLDNSPRFDYDEDLDAVDFTTFLAHDSLYLSYIYSELGNEAKSNEWKNKYETLKKAINGNLWDENTCVYQDRLFSGKFAEVLTPFVFLPMFANIPTKEQVEKMIPVLTDKNLLWSKCPLASVSQTHATYSNDMWRGGVWLNLNYFIMKGLMNYGYTDIAEKLKEETLEMVNKWYKKTGSIFEFYDPENEVVPYCCERKGKCPKTPDWRKHVHAIMDYNWSASFVIMFIQNELY